MKNDTKMDDSIPNGDDSLLDEHLATLPHFDPYPGFEDRVMSRVLMPPPRWILSVRKSFGLLIETRRIRWIAAGLALTSTISVVCIAALFLTNFPTVSRAFDWFAANVGIPVWRTFLGFTSETVRDVYASLPPLRFSRTMAVIVAAASLGFLVVNSWMLLWIMRPNRMTQCE